MRQTLRFTFILLLVAIPFAMLHVGPAATPAAAQGAKLDGKAIFLAQKCNLCHSVSSAGIEATTKSEKMKGPDLVNIKHDAKLLNGYLRKTADIRGKKHAKGFTGSDEELGALIAWIQAQKK